MADLTSCELDALPVPLDFGPVLKSATQTISKRSSKRSAGGGKNGRRARHVEEEPPTLVRKHATVKHLYACERNHRWQWVPEKSLSLLWHDLTHEEKAFIVKTHQEDSLTPNFRQEFDEQIRTVECFASEQAKESLASMIWFDQSGLALFKRIFVAAVEQNYPMVIDMEVIAAVDAVIQDFCATVNKMKQEKRFPYWVTGAAILLVVCWLWIIDSEWTPFAMLLSIFLSMHHTWRNLPPLDPRDFAVGSDLWVQYREREHVRLMWMSATVRVFEVRLIRVLEFRRWAARQAEAARRLKPEQLLSLPPSPLAGAGGAGCVPDAASRREDGEEEAPKRKQRPARLRRRAQAASDAEEAAGRMSAPCEAAPAELAAPATLAAPAALAAPALIAPAALAAPWCAYPTAPQTLEERLLRRSSRPEQPLGADAAPLPMSELQAAWLAEDDGEEEEEEGAFTHEDGGDEIDAEFARRVQEHFQTRVQAAGKDPSTQTVRGNQILKSLCEKLKMELERAVPS